LAPPAHTYIQPTVHTYMYSDRLYIHVHTLSADRPDYSVRTYM
jgi:hypothetical protein